MDRWEWRYADIIENHLAVEQIAWRALGRGQNAILLPDGMVHLVLTLFTAAFGSRFLAAAVILTVKLLPLCAILGATAYCQRLLRHSWLRKEWWDFLRQWDASATEETCPICTEPVKATDWHVAELPCCRARICWTCLRRHAESVIDDARPEMLCPLLPCRQVLPDVVVSTALRRERCQWNNPDLFMGRRERRKYRAYERWALAAGLAASCSARMEDVISCPTEDCNNKWVLPRELRQQKAGVEPQSRWNPKSWWFGRHCGFYSAPAGEDGSDLRMVYCYSCQGSHCMLCGLRWRDDNGGDHGGKSCVEHAAALPEERRRKQDERAGVANWAGAKPCPGCGTRIIRSWGCNHMSCTQCGHEWCWVCLADWAPRHYACQQDTSSSEQCRIL